MEDWEEAHEVVKANINQLKDQVMSSNFFPHLISKFGDLIEFSVLKDCFN